MNFETAAEAFIRPTIGPATTPAHSAAVSASTGAAPAQQAAGPGEGSARERGGKAEHETAAGGLSFYDLLDVINPLQHIPGLASAYRAMTGDEIKAPAQILGGMLFGGGIGLAAAAANAVVKESSGRDIGETTLAMLFGEEPAPDGTLAAATASEAVLAAQSQPAAGPQAILPAAASAAADEAADLPADRGGEDAAAVMAAVQAPGGHSPAGPSLTGKAALKAFLNDLAAVGRGAQGVAPPAAEELAQASAGRTPMAAQAFAEPQAPREQGNLIGLGSRDKRPSARKEPAIAVPAARLIGPAQAGTTADAGQKAPRITSGTAPRLPGATTVDPTLFATEANSDLNAVPRSSSASDNAVPNDFSQQMMRALQKYETMLDDRPAAGDPS